PENIWQLGNLATWQLGKSTLAKFTFQYKKFHTCNPCKLDFFPLTSPMSLAIDRNRFINIKKKVLLPQPS
ncbi:hypothetical protein OAA19_03290, partial [Rubripirellula sp.]